jgi:alpha-mannosidase
MEDPIPGAEHLQLTGDVVTIPIKPYEILTLQVTYPAKATATK